LGGLWLVWGLVYWVFPSCTLVLTSLKWCKTKQA
jgi:hypothetical protein